MASKDADDRPEYIFERGFRSSIRLNYNHWIMKEACGYLLHPSIPRPSGSARVADVGTGTSLWLQETAATLPDSIHFDGFDISAAQYPPESWRPANIRLYVHDAFRPFPAEFQGQYDIVHARFFLCLVNDQDAEGLLKNLVSLLKPGGYLQWFEPNANLAKMVSQNPAGVSSTASVEKLAESWRKPRPDSSYNWLANMPQLFATNGLTLEVRDEHPIPNRLRLPWAQSSLAGLEDLISGSQVVEAQSQAIRNFIDGLTAEFKEGVYVEVPMVCFVGRKVMGVQ